MESILQDSTYTKHIFTDLTEAESKVIRFKI